MTIYIAGPMTGLPDYNRDSFNMAEAELNARGHRVLNPAKLPELPYEMYLPINRAMLDGADAIYMLPGWKGSRGARLEYEYAQEIGLEVFDEYGQF